MAKQSKGRPAAAAASTRSSAITSPPSRLMQSPSMSNRKQRPREQLQTRTSAAATVPTWLPNVFVMLVALASVAFELTTASHYAQSKELLSTLKKCFIAFVCLTSRMQLADVFAPPPHRPLTLRAVVWSHVKALGVAILANSAGTTIIRPLFGAAPQYEETVRLVVPIYFAVEAAIALLRIPVPVLSLVLTLGVSWLKAVTIANMVSQWQTRGANAHSIGFVLVSAANLYASGLALRYIKHWHASTSTAPPVAVTAAVVSSLVRILLLSAAIGLVAHTANDLATQRERQREAAALHFLIAWFALDKYWKAPLTTALARVRSAAVARRNKRVLKPKND